MEFFYLFFCQTTRFISHLLSRGYVLCKLDLCEVSLPDGLEQPVLADVGLLPARAAGGDAGGGGGAIATLEHGEKEKSN